MKKPLSLIALSAFVFISWIQAAAPERPKAPYRMLFSNDTTNILSCTSPYHGPGDRELTDDMIRASVDEAAVEGMDAQLLQPGMGWLPWWPSKVIPLDEHLKWFSDFYEATPSGAYFNYVSAGNDMVKAFTDQVRSHNRAAFVSLRLNDVHALDKAFEKGPKQGRYAMSFARFYSENPQFLIGEPADRNSRLRVQDWAHPEVPAYKLKLIEELCQNYELEGIELDFMRWASYFKPGFDGEQAKKIMTKFVGDVRKALDASSKNGKYRYLSVRIPVSDEQWEQFGIDPVAFYAAGVDIFNLSNSYCTTQQTPIAKLRKLVPKASIVLELTMTTATWKVTAGGGDNANFRRSTKEVLENTARIAYARGADGVSFFNFVYYRPFGSAREMRGPFCEPPFEWLSALRSPEGVKDAPPYYYYNPEANGGQIASRALVMAPKADATLTMDMLPMGNRGEGRLRIQVIATNERGLGENDPAKDIFRGKWRVRLNEREIKPIKFDGELYPFDAGEIRAGFGQPEQFLAFSFPPSLIKDGPNRVDLWYEKGEKPLIVRFIDIYKVE